MMTLWHKKKCFRSSRENINQDVLKDKIFGAARTGRTKTGEIREGPPVIEVDRNSDNSGNISLVWTRSYWYAFLPAPAKLLPSTPPSAVSQSELEHFSTPATNISHSISWDTKVHIIIERCNVVDTQKSEKENTHKTKQHLKYKTTTEIPSVSKNISLDDNIENTSLKKTQGFARMIIKIQCMV